MLPFMREQGVEDSSVQKPLVAAGRNLADNAQEAQQQGGHQEYLTVAAQGKNVRKTTCLLAVVFGIGLLCLLYMIKKSAPHTTTAGTATAETKIETAIQKLTGIKSEMFSRMDEIVRKFYEFSDVKQVNVSELVKNPFKYDLFLDSLRESSGAQTDGHEPDADAIRLQLIRQQTKALQLMSIMHSPQGNCCMINDKVFYKGDSIKDFRIRHIGDTFVKLEWTRQTQDQTHETKDQNPESGVSSPQPVIILKLSE